MQQLSDETIRLIESEQAKTDGVTRENLTLRTVRAALIAQHGFCGNGEEDDCTCAREIGYRVCQPSPKRVACGHCDDTGYLPDLNNCQHCALPLDNAAILKVARQHFKVDADTSAKSLQAYCDSVRAVIDAYVPLRNGSLDWSHSDDLAVDAFAIKMKAKLKLAREQKGRGGWEGCDPALLSRMLYAHVEKGDPLDVANFCMMLVQLDSPIAM